MRAVVVVLLMLCVAAPLAAEPLDATTAYSQWNNANTAYKNRDYATALRLFRAFAERGDPIAQGMLGTMYQDGQGVPKNDVEALNWYRRAAEQGSGIAQAFLGIKYALGEGVPQDFVLAHMWFNLSAAQGDQDSVKMRDSTGEQMTRAQIAEAQKLAREWKPRTER